MAQDVVEKDATQEELLKVIEDLRRSLAERNAVIELQRHQYAELQRILFGRRSERVAESDPAQGLLFNEAERDAALETKDPEPATVEHVTRPAGRRGGRRRPSSELPRIEVHHDLSEEEKQCPWCGGDRAKIGEERSEEIEIIPARVVVKVHVRAKYGPCHCDDFVGNDEPAVIVAPAPAKIAPGSLYSNNAAAFFIVTKYADAMPFHRQEQSFARIGLELGRGTMARLTIRIAQALSPLIDCIKRDVRGSPVLRMDETVVQVLKEDGRPPSAQSRMWVAMGYRDERPIIYFAYHDSRSGDVAEAIIGDGFSGFLQTDGYAGYTRVGRRPGIVHVGCWAHIRREFYELTTSGASTPFASDMVKRIRELYAIERRLRSSLDAGTMSQDEFLRRRKEEAEPVMQAIRLALEAKQSSVPPRTPLGKAITYAIGQFPRACRYVDHVLLTPDNNLIENAIRPFVIGRKNWNFSDTPRGAEASAHLYTLIETAKANGHEPYRYLCYLFDQLPRANSPEERERLLPHRLRPSDY
jgi:transposase